MDFKSTVFLPKTDFALRANLSEREAQILETWQKTDLFSQLRKAHKGQEKFLLHDGPPYANGHIHIGTALNKILKDMVNRSQFMLGKDVNYVPGWDCHGLPIEWQIEQQYRKAGRDKDKVPVAEFRRECEQFAKQWLDTQRQEFKRLGVNADWDHPYMTMSPQAEAQILREIGKFVMNGGLYLGFIPVLWSVIEKTALAEAEVEYHDKNSSAIYVRFPLVKTSLPSLKGKNCYAVIWTTTPWTLPANRAIAFGADLSYVALKVEQTKDNVAVQTADIYLVAADLVQGFCEATGITQHQILQEIKGSMLAGSLCQHPLHGKGYDFNVPLVEGHHVTTEQGTGLVHIAPSHGSDDFEIGKKYKLEVPNLIMEDGSYSSTVPLFAGARILKLDGKTGDADKVVIEVIRQATHLLSLKQITHSYPHSWRSKSPLIYRATPQIFISMDKNQLRKKALKAIDRTHFIPVQGKQRLKSMIEQRPDWCISRQRSWGTPIALFIHKRTGEILRDQKVIDRIAQAFEKEGANAWFSGNHERFLTPEYQLADYNVVMDTVDVWFDSASTHSFVLENRQHTDMKWPADLYLEGSDQHRGWFHTSLLESCGTRGEAPFKALLTHGFVLDEQGRKMSKSLGNVMAPADVIKQYGADVLRLWVVASDYTDDLRIGPEILKHQAESYRRLRNTLRYLLGALNGFEAGEKLPVDQLPVLEKWVLHRLWQLDKVVRQSCSDFAFHRLFSEISHFCAIDLSAFYFDVRKDSLYCDDLANPTRRATQTVMHEVFECLTAWLAPILCFTAEEAWQTYHPNSSSVHLRTFPIISDSWENQDLADKFVKIRSIRRVVTGALEIARAEQKIGSSLQAKPIIYGDKSLAKLLQLMDVADLMITSTAEVRSTPAPAHAFKSADMPEVAVVVELADGQKCDRCWKTLPEVGSFKAYPSLCGRCHDVIQQAGQSHV